MSKQNELVQFSRGASGGGSKNLIINGAMNVAQRSTTASVTSSGYKTVDRFLMNIHSDFNSKSTMTQNLDSLTPPDYFNNYLGLKIDTATTATGDVFYNFRQQLEGYNISHLKFGTSSARSITISFWVRSTLTGNFSLTLRNGASDRSFVTTYNISTANTWEKKTITVAGDTTGTWTSTNAIGLTINFGHGSAQGLYSTSTLNAWQSGSFTGATSTVQMVETVNSKWYITGVQLEVNDNATDFEHRSFGDELQSCRRYYHKQGTTYGFVVAMQTSTSCYSNPTFPVEMRAAPTVDIDHANINLYVQGAKTTTADFAQNIQPRSFQFHLQSSGASAGDAGHIDAPTLFYTADAEL